MANKGIPKDKRKVINVRLDRDLYDSLAQFAHWQSMLQGKGFPIIEALRTAIEVFLRLEVGEMKEILERDVRDYGNGDKWGEDLGFERQN
ncbi:MAG: hypothetical protein JRF35_01865 [Deltaproteobacteria bacterium]|nr:hypothetical protein [Deltaproteobacteria bacterium]MBW2309808.1 hypothetical protein [Deltaproteobacteria bacterium]